MMSAQALRKKLVLEFIVAGFPKVAEAISVACERLIVDDESDAVQLGILTIDPGTSPTVAAKGRKAA